MTNPTPADAVREAVHGLSTLKVSPEEIAAAAIRAAVNALLPLPASDDTSEEADNALLLRLQFLELVAELFAPLPAASQEALAEAREEALTSEDITPGPYSEQGLRDRWNAQASVGHDWDALDSDEQLAWAQTQAIAAARAALADPAGEGE